MTKEEALRWSELFKAYAEGKQIQYRWSSDDKWENIDFEKEDIEDKLKYAIDQYRIKPEPKYIPYTWEDWREFMMKKIIHKKSKKEYIVIGVQKEDIGIDVEDDNNWLWPSYKKAFEDYEFEDGDPFGKLVEE